MAKKILPFSQIDKNDIAIVGGKGANLGELFKIKAPVPNGRVRYVKEGGTQAVDKPNGSPVTQLNQGEHPVTWEENGWLKVANGFYLPATSMSDKGVPRSTGNATWK